MIVCNPSNAVRKAAAGAIGVVLIWPILAAPTQAQEPVDDPVNGTVAVHGTTTPDPRLWGEPVNLGPTVNSPYDEVFATISRDGLTLYFASNRPRSSDGEPEGDLDIFVSGRRSLEAPWSEPERLPAPINTAAHGEHSVTFSPDGHWMYFVRENAPDGCGGWDIYAAYRADPTDPLGWEQPRNLGCQINSPQHDSCPLMKKDDETGTVTLYFVSTREAGMGSWDIYSAVRAWAPDSFAEPVHMPEVSSPAADGHFDPFDDGLAMVWSNRDGTQGDMDLWVSTRDPVTRFWTDPVNAGPELNTEHRDGMPSVTADGDHLILTSTRPGGVGGSDIYVSQRIRPR